MVVTDDEELYWRAFALHDHGHTPNRTGVQVCERSIIGFNFRMNELTGAVALAQVRKIDQITRRAGTAAADGSFPRTDDILERSVNISIGVVDEGIGSGYGININSSDVEIEKRTVELKRAIGTA